MLKKSQRLKNGQLRVDVDDRSFVFETNTDKHTVPTDFSIEHVRNDLYSILYKGKSISAVAEGTDANRLTFTVDGTVFSLHIVDHRQQLLEAFGEQDAVDNHNGQIRAPMPGLVLKLQVEPGSEVSINDPLLVLEAMKMENEIRAPGDGIVSTVFVKPGEAVLKNAPLMEITPADRTS